MLLPSSVVSVQKQVFEDHVGNGTLCDIGVKNQLFVMFKNGWKKTTLENTQR